MSGDEARCHACGHYVELHTKATGRPDTGCAMCERLRSLGTQVTQCRLGRFVAAQPGDGGDAAAGES